MSLYVFRSRGSNWYFPFICLILDLLIRFAVLADHVIVNSEFELIRSHFAVFGLFFLPTIKQI